MSKNIKVHLSLFTVGLIYGANYAIAKDVMPEHIRPFGLILFRVFFATILFWVYHAVFIREKVDNPRDYRKFAICAIFGVAANMLCFFKGLSLTSSINASLIMTLVPVIVLVASYIILKEKITRLKLIGVLIGGLGAMLLISNGEVGWGNNRFIGDLLIIANASFYGVYLVIVRPLMKKYHAFTVIKWVFLFGLIMVFPFGIGELIKVEWLEVPARIWWDISFIVVGTTFFAYLLNAWSLKYVSSAVVGIYIYLQPVFATFISIVWMGESLGWQKLIFSILIFTGVYLVSKKQN